MVFVFPVSPNFLAAVPDLDAGRLRADAWLWRGWRYGRLL